MHTNFRFVVVAVVSIVLLGASVTLYSARLTGEASPAPVPAPILFGGPSEERDSIVAYEARRAGMDPALAIAVSHMENWSGDSAAAHPRSGAVGLMQVMPFWTDSFPADCYGPGDLTMRSRNACIGARIAVRYFRECGNWNCALVRYVGAECTRRDTPLRCTRKNEIGKGYVLAVVERFGRTDLSPARDAMAYGSWRTAAESSGSHRPDRIQVLDAHSSRSADLAAGTASRGSLLSTLVAP